jgi:hypothetical protein
MKPTQIFLGATVIALIAAAATGLLALRGRQTEQLTVQEAVS